jgi:GNAT superfamily N-acetyltransferase
VSGLTPIEPEAEAEEEWEVTWEIRAATHTDVPAVAVGVNRLLEELGGKPVATGELEQTTRALIDDAGAGVLLVAENLSEVVGVLGVSWQLAMRVPGRYGLIQELWIHPAFRGMTIGGELVVALFDIARSHGVKRLEVGLPSERFPHLDATEAFYVNNGFTVLGTRMRRLL